MFKGTPYIYGVIGWTIIRTMVWNGIDTALKKVML